MATFCLIHGSWHDGSCWDPLSAALARRGHEALSPTMPLDDPEAGFEDRFRPIAAALAAGADPLVVVGHSVSSGFAAVAAERAARLLPVAPLAEDQYPIDGHPDLPTALIYATEDEFFEPGWERFMARELLGVEPIEIPGGHFPMLEDPEGLADLLDRRSGT